MGKPSKGTPAPKTQRDTGTQLSRQIPDLFRSQGADRSTQSTGPPSPASSASDGTPDLDRADDPTLVLPNLLALVHQMPRMADLTSIASDIKATFSAAISDLKSHLHQMGERLHVVEETSTRHESVIKRLRRSTVLHHSRLLDLHRHVEDLDNRGRRHNIRVRGLPETVDNAHLEQALLQIFNGLLDSAPDEPIAMERYHRALRPRGRDSEPPRDVVCCLVDFRLKEEILRRARAQPQLQFQGHRIQLYQDLSHITLQHRRALRPLLQQLTSRGIAYRWRFPFGLVVNQSGRSHLLVTPEDLPGFCAHLDLPRIELPEWYADFRVPSDVDPSGATPPSPTIDDGHRNDPSTSSRP